MEIPEIIERVECLRSSLDNSFKTGAIDFDHFIDELESWKPELVAIGEKLNNLNIICTPPKARMQEKLSQVALMNICPADYR